MSKTLQLAIMQTLQGMGALQRNDLLYIMMKSNRTIPLSYEDFEQALDALAHAKAIVTRCNIIDLPQQGNDQ